jgi:hypothetical protein
MFDSFIAISAVSVFDVEVDEEVKLNKISLFPNRQLRNNA